ncbi:hypothetical protein RDWZM_001301 [Blomia tropicalis]|uniref:Ubiquitin conjugation factor E4 A n=1 Tax=Blomia tropicalis TaxID=40697 RepID=A0A9Q0RQH6_BLOTA|nr:hypothetical protein RDWZM_001301 [Blomia tropicalis]
MSSPMETNDGECRNILEDKNSYIHQYLTTVFQICLKKSPTSSTADGLHAMEDKNPIVCLNLSDVDESQLSLANYTQWVFESLMNQNIEQVTQYVDKRFLPVRGNLFNNTYRVYADDSNRVAYLFNCYCRLEFVNDFAHFISTQERMKLKRYIIDQVALIFACPYANVRYPENSSITPYTDMFQVLTQDIPWPSEYLIFLRKFFVDVTDAIHNAKNGSNTNDVDDYVSSLCDLTHEELNLEQIIKPIYDQLCKRFKTAHSLSAPFVDDIKYVNILIASPHLAEVFIDLNSPPKLRDQGNGSQNSSESSERNNASTDSNEIFRSFLMNTLSSLDLPLANGPGNLSREVSPNLERFFHESLLGILLCNSPLPSPFSKKKELPSVNILLSVFHGSEYEYSFFSYPTTKTPTEIERIELDIDDTLSKLRSNLTDVFYSLLKSPSTVRSKTLKWIECCLATFNNRSKLWANELMALVGGNTSSNTSDGFVLNFSAVLLNLCKPFCSTPYSFNSNETLSVNSKMLKVDPIYMGFSKRKDKTSTNDYAPYLEILGQESVLINVDSTPRNNNNSDATMDDSSLTSIVENDEIKFVNYQPNFITKCFFATHKALHLGFRVIHERFHQINQENSQLQRRLESLGLSSLLHYMNRDNLTPQQQEVLQRLDQNMTVTLSMKSTLVETTFINLLLEFYLATATWINNLAVCENETEAAQSFKNLELILNGEKQPTSSAKNSSAGKCLKWIPEFLVENIIDFMLFLRYFEVKPKVISLKTDLEPFLTMIVLFMGTQNRMRNPHLRAKMAEMLEALLPHVQSNIQHSFLDTLFQKQYFIDHLFPALLNVFVSIEISDETNNGDVVAFEQKFNYRRPMYIVFKYLCTVPEHQTKLKQLAAFAEHNMDSVQSPIFLRFINLLINDAIFLLDEGLSLMSKLREAQQERDSGAWTRESNQQRQQNEANFIHLGRLAKFHNFIGRDTIATLTTITDYVKSFFSHKILVDRMASMLNYFLHHLVGPNKRNFKVKQMNEYDFNPGELVKNICRIYVNLACPSSLPNNSVSDGGFNEKYEQFCLAICQDDRSYSADLLGQAYQILISKLGQPVLAEDINTVDLLVKEVMRRQRKREIPLEDIPEEFLDPLMSTIMSDPVILPGSRKVLDRATITRHLLSDHTDPYTRAPLTMDMLIPDVEMKRKIEEFVTSKLKAMDQDMDA